MDRTELRQGLSRHEQVSQWVRERIEGGALGADAQLPSEHDLSARFGVSRVTVRRALQTLEADGLIYRRQGLGSFVSPPRVAQGLVRLTDFAQDMERAGLSASSRVLHHAPVPARALRALAELARPPSGDAPGGAVCILDYEAHDDQALREQQADLWLGFEPRELKRLARGAGLIDVTWQRLPAAWQGEGPDRHLAWQLLVGKRGNGSPVEPTGHLEEKNRKRKS